MHCNRLQTRSVLYRALVAMQTHGPAAAVECCLAKHSAVLNALHLLAGGIT